MALVNQVQKRVKMPKWNIVKFQILTHCYINNILVSESDLNCLTLLSFNQPVELTNFCYDASSEEEWMDSFASIFICPHSALANSDGLVNTNGTSFSAAFIVTVPV